MEQTVDYFIVVMLGLLVAVAELASRYRDAPWAALYTRPALFYIVLNSSASGCALALIRTFDWNFGATGAAVRWTQVLVAGMGAMAVFRTSLFTVRVGDKDVGVGPASFLEIFRDTADREVDRLRARARGMSVGKLMDEIEYKKASEGLVPYCLALMQNVPDEEQQKLLHAVQLLDSEPIDGSVKVRILGLLLMNVVGPEVATAAVEVLREQLKATAAAAHV
jgi:hypothetical protein